MKDYIYSDSEIAHPDLSLDNAELRSFAFNSKVASVFDDMVSRSVPGYEEVQQFTVEFASKLKFLDTKVFDLGCATGTTLVRLANEYQSSGGDSSNSQKPLPKFIGIDSSQYMVAKCREKVEALALGDLIEIIHQEVEDLSFPDASFVISHYTLQFMPPENRLDVLARIYQGLKQDGYLILSEKIRFADPTAQEFITSKYYQHKKNMGYSEVEISRKREALENVLIPLTVEENIELLKKAGFQDISIVSSKLLFVTFLAKKS